MKNFAIVETDNFGGDYPNEKFVNIPNGREDVMQAIADIINKEFCKTDYAPRFWKVVATPYKLQPGFQP